MLQVDLILRSDVEKLIQKKIKEDWEDRTPEWWNWLQELLEELWKIERYEEYKSFMFNASHTIIYMQYDSKIIAYSYPQMDIIETYRLPSSL